MKADVQHDAPAQYYMLLVTLTDRGTHLTYSCSHPSGVQLPLNLTPQTLARVCCPKHVLCNQLLEFTVDTFRFVSWPVNLEASRGDHLTKFNIVAVLPENQPNRHNMARDVIPQLAFALCHEQSNRNFMSDSVAILSQLRDLQFHDANMQLRSSSLVRSLNEICEALATNTLCNILINGRIHVGVSEGAATHGNDEHSGLRPYRTVLLLEDANSLLTQLPEDASTSLRRLIRIANPMKSFRDLSVDLGLPITHVFRLAAHLVSWRKARVMNTLTKHSVLTINPDAILNRSVTDAFKVAFPTLELSDQLSRFTVPKKLEDHLRILGQPAQHQIVTLIVFLLRHSLLILLHTYVSLIPEHGVSCLPANGSDRSVYSTSIESTSSYNRNFSTSPQIQADPAYPVTKSSKLKKLLHRLIPYFNGEHHIEEIMWSENISRQDIAQILLEYSDRLCTYNHEGLS